MTPRRLEATVHHRAACELGEGPFWHEEQIWWVDIERGLLLSADRQGTLVHRMEFGQCIGAAVPTLRQTFLAALEREIAEVDWRDQSSKTIARPDQVPKDGRFNDGKCDPRGRFIVGTLSPEGREKTAALYSLHADGSLQWLRGNTSISNGLAWSADGRTMYFIDTPQLCVFAYDYDLETGAIAHERIVLRFPEKDGWPDGMTIDREGRLWIGFWDGWAVRCYRPETGDCEAMVPVPCARATSCCFGMDGLDRLFITTARTGLSESDLREQPLAGSLFVCDPGTSGFATACSHYRAGRA